MTLNKIRLLLTGFAFALGTMASPVLAETPAAQASLAGTAIKFEHVENNRDGAKMSGAITVEVMDDTNATVNPNRGYTVNIKPDLLTIRFTKKASWSNGNLFSGLVIDDIKWGSAPERAIADVRLSTKIPYFSKKHITKQSNSVLLDLRGLSVKSGDSLTLSLETGGN